MIEAPSKERSGVVGFAAVVHGSGMSGIVRKLRPIGHGAEEDDSRDH